MMEIDKKKNMVYGQQKEARRNYHRKWRRK